MSQDAICGLCGIFPKWLQNRATAKTFLVVYGLLGTVQSMAFVYVMVTLTTLEKRFKIPSRTTGIILSGNEISQILSLVLTYYGGSGHRPRWIAVGVALSAFSCVVLSLPHFIYGPGKDALALTQEYLDQNLLNATVTEDLPTCSESKYAPRCDEESLEDLSVLPRLLVFLSQFILGIGTTLYYGLGQPYLDDNTKKKNTPMLLGLTFSLRTLGPVVGFVLGYACLRLYIDPTLHPVIPKDDPRWLGAWWLGWLILGATMGMFAVFIAMFPRHLPKSNTSIQKEGEEPLKYGLSLPKIESNIKTTTDTKKPGSEIEYTPNMKDFITSLKRLMLNPILTCNNLSAVFYILGASVYITFMSKYMEVLFGVSAASSSVITGPITLVGMAVGLLVSGTVISKYKPGPRILLGWNVIIGVFFVLGEVGFLFLSCPGTAIQGIDPNSMQINLNFSCNVDCGCEHVKYSPVCHEPSMTTFFSACHAGCKTVLPNGGFGNCTCISEQISIENSLYESGLSISPLMDKEVYLTSILDKEVMSGACKSDCKGPYLIWTIIMCFMQLLTCSGKIGNILVNYRSVDERDKSFAQGISLMMISLFALIPGPIIYGALIDSTCLVWDDACGIKGNCWIYDPDKFRNYINNTAICFTILGVLFDIGVWYLGKNVDLYGAEEQDMRHDFVKSLSLELTKTSDIDKNENSTEKNSHVIHS